MSRLSNTLPLHARTSEAATVVTVAAARLTEENASRLCEQVADLLGGRVPPQLHLDLRQVQVLTSIPLGQLIELNKRVRQAGGHLVVENVTPPGRRHAPHQPGGPALRGQAPGRVGRSRS